MNYGISSLFETKSLLSRREEMPNTLKESMWA